MLMTLYIDTATQAAVWSILKVGLNFSENQFSGHKSDMIWSDSDNVKAESPKMLLRSSHVP